MELGGKDLFDGGEFVEPGEDLGGRLVIEEALVEFLADIMRDTGNFAGEGVLGVVTGGV